MDLRELVLDPSGDDDGAVVLKLPAGEGAAVFEHGRGDLVSGRAGVCCEHRVESLDPVHSWPRRASMTPSV